MESSSGENSRLPPRNNSSLLRPPSGTAAVEDKPDFTAKLFEVRQPNFPVRDCCMWRQNDVLMVELQQGIIRLPGLLVPDIHRQSAKPSGLQRRDNRIAIDERRAGRVDAHCA